MSNNIPILVTGAAGNVGSVGRDVVKLLRERDLQVRALVHRLDERSQVLMKYCLQLIWTAPFQRQLNAEMKYFLVHLL
jgi:nucleoside-diphosphate-sugar epimerase